MIKDGLESVLTCFGKCNVICFPRVFFVIPWGRGVARQERTKTQCFSTLTLVCLQTLWHVCIIGGSEWLWFSSEKLVYSYLKSWLLSCLTWDLRIQISKKLLKGTLGGPCCLSQCSGLKQKCLLRSSVVRSINAKLCLKVWLILRCVLAKDQKFFLISSHLYTSKEKTISPG